MKKNMTGWIIGGLMGVSVLGAAFGTNVCSAAEKPAMPMQEMKMEHGQMGNMDMHQMMKSPEMQKHCLEMMKNPEMQKHCLEMMKSPEMQTMMKQMLTNDPALKQMMSDLINSIDTNNQTNMPVNTESIMVPAEDHSAHHHS